MLSYVCYLLNCNFIVKRVFIIPFLASHIDTTILSDGTYELIPESEEGDQEAQLNATILTEDPDQSSEEVKTVLASDYREGKPRTTHILNYYNLSLLLTCAFTFLRI